MEAIIQLKTNMQLDNLEANIQVVNIPEPNISEVNILEDIQAVILKVNSLVLNILEVLVANILVVNIPVVLVVNILVALEVNILVALVVNIPVALVVHILVALVVNFPEVNNPAAIIPVLSNSEVQVVILNMNPEASGDVQETLKKKVETMSLLINQLTIQDSKVEEKGKLKTQAMLLLIVSNANRQNVSDFLALFIAWVRDKKFSLL